MDKNDNNDEENNNNIAESQPTDKVPTEKVTNDSTPELLSTTTTATTTTPNIVDDEEEADQQPEADVTQVSLDDDDDDDDDAKIENKAKEEEEDRPAMTPLQAAAATVAADFFMEIQNDDNSNDQIKATTTSLPNTPTRTYAATTTTTTATMATPPPIQRKRSSDDKLPTYSECLYGVPEDDEVWEAFFDQPDAFSDHDVIVESLNDKTNDNHDEDDDNEPHVIMEVKEPQPSDKKKNDDVDPEEMLWKRQARVRGHAVPMGSLRRLAAQGIPDEGSHRGVVWRLLLGPYLPPDDIDVWPTTLTQQRAKYAALCERYFDEWNDWTFGRVLRVQRKQEHVKRMMQQGRGRQQEQQQVMLHMDVDDDYQSIHITAGVAAAGHEDPSSSHDHDDDDLDGGADSYNPNIRQRITRPTPSTELFDNPNVLNHIPRDIQTAWVDRGKDLHILKSLMKSFNALKVPTRDNENDDDEGGDNNDNSSDQAAISDFVDSAILLDEIRKDVVRTHADLAFFLDPHDDLGRRRYAAIERILFLWSKHNSHGVKYVQGMNEIVGALYYVLANDWRTEWANAAEADTYWLLGALLTEFHDVFVPELDAVDTGIRGRISALSDLLQRHDPALHEHFADIGVDASFYAVRWLTTLLSREFLLPDTIRLWDSMFASTHKDNFLRYLCVTMLFNIRDALLQGDFGTCIRLLQEYPPTHMDRLLEASRSLYIYETQITVACHKAGLTQHAALLSIAPPPGLFMAFGFTKGVAPPPTLSSSERVQNATSAVASSARNFYNRMFGGGRKRAWSSDAAALTRSKSAGQVTTPTTTTQAAAEPPNLTRGQSSPERPSSSPRSEASSGSPDIYLKAILGSPSS